MTSVDGLRTALVLSVLLLPATGRQLKTPPPTGGFLVSPTAPRLAFQKTALTDVVLFAGLRCNSRLTLNPSHHGFLHLQLGY
jgi:hypothetical protein